MLITIFCILVAFFVLIAGIFFIPVVGDLFKGSQFLLPFIGFSFLGGVLIFFTRKEKMKGMLKKYLILTGASAAGLVVSIFLHNFFYAAAILAGHLPLLPLLFEILHGLFFTIAIFVCPFGFLVGAGGSIILFMKEKR